MHMFGFYVIAILVAAVALISAIFIIKVLMQERAERMGYEWDSTRLQVKDKRKVRQS